MNTVQPLSPLERKELPPAINTSQSVARELAFNRLALEASRHLGYHALARSITTTTSNLNSTPLQYALRALRIKPFTPESVQKYKREQLQRTMIEASPEYWTHPILYRYLAPVLEVLAGLTASGVIFGVITTAAAMQNMNKNSHWTLWVLAVSFVLFVASASGALSLPQKREFAWRRIRIWGSAAAGYKKEMPAYVLQVMLQVQLIYPSIRFYVEEIGAMEEGRQYDPFLVVSDEYGIESFYIEVWKEPGFTQRKLI